MNAIAVELVDVETVAKHFGVGVRTINDWVRRGRIPYLRPSRKVVRFNMAEVEAALTHNQGHAPGDATTTQ